MLNNYEKAGGYRISQGYDRVRYGSVKNCFGRMFFKILNAHRDFTPAAVAPKKNFNRRTGNTSSSLSAAAIWGTGAVPSFLIPVLPVLVKGIFQNPYSFMC